MCPTPGIPGDCDTYHGWVVGVDINNPSNVHAWATTAIGGGIWGHGGVASDGTNMFVVTGNTFNTGGNWMGGEAIIRLQAGPIWTWPAHRLLGAYNWFSLDNSDTDLGGVSATVIDVPGATPSQLVLALGKDGNAYLVNRNNLGGITSPVAQANVGGINRGTSAVTYHTSQGTYIGFHNDAGTIRAYKITATNPPTIMFAWSQSQSGRGSPWVTTTDGTNNVIVWVAGVAGDQRLHGYDGDTGAVIYAGGGANELMTGTRQWNTGMVARGRIYFGADNKSLCFHAARTEHPRLHLLLALHLHLLLQRQLPQHLPQLLLQLHGYCNCDAHCHLDSNSNTLLLVPLPPQLPPLRRQPRLQLQRGRRSRPGPA